MELVGQLRNPDDAVVANESIFVLTILEKVNKTEIKIFSRKCNIIINNGKVLKSENFTNKYTIKQIGICSKKQDRNNIKIK